MSTEAELQPVESDSPGQPPTLPAVPRPLNRRARLRSWAEMSVRVWLILCLAVAFVTVYFTIVRLREALDERWLFDHGADVKAIFVEVNHDPVPKRRVRSETMPAIISFKINGKEYRQDITLVPKAGANAIVGTELPIKVDPNNPARLMEVAEPPPWSHELAIVGVLIPVLIAVILLVLWKRQRVLSVWKTGALTVAVVVELRQTPVAPMSRVVRFTLVDGADRRIRTTLMPSAAGVPQIGERIWLISPPNNPGRAIVAKLYQDG